ncbi:hypothetical protein Pvag_pPag20066 (plasmid) [Pantoea vagans C9-1]|nr:hypothetical protein Pvag_pPag20066 [Pantoea vagans C9-1]
MQAAGRLIPGLAIPRACLAESHGTCLLKDAKAVTVSTDKNKRQLQCLAASLSWISIKF